MLNLSVHGIQTTVSQNEIENFIFGGDTTPDGISDGTVMLFRNIYDNDGGSASTSNACNNVGLTITADGFYSSQPLPQGTPVNNTGCVCRALFTSHLAF